MSLFGSELYKQPVLTENLLLILKNNTFLGDLLCHHGAIICWSNDDTTLQDLINPYVENIKYVYLLSGRKVGAAGVFSPDDSVLTAPPVLQKHQGRSIITLDCSRLKKGDAIGFMHQLSLLPSEQKPVVIINNITNIPSVGSNIDDPLYVENLLLHSWHNDVIQLADKDGAPFTIKTSDYTVLIPIVKQSKRNINLSRLSNDFYPQLQLEESLESWLSRDFYEVREYYSTIGRLSTAQNYAVTDYLNSPNKI